MEADGGHDSVFKLLRVDARVNLATMDDLVIKLATQRDHVAVVNCLLLPPQWQRVALAIRLLAREYQGDQSYCVNCFKFPRIYFLQNNAKSKKIEMSEDRTDTD